VITAKGETILVRPNEARVVGVLASHPSYSEPGLVALENDQRTLTLNGRNWRQKVLQSTAPIDCVAVSHAFPHIAYSTTTGEVVVFSLQHRADICRYVVERPA
jgi:hypothetical protein